MRSATVRGALLGAISGGVLATLYGLVILLLLIGAAMFSTILNATGYSDFPPALAAFIILPLGMIVVWMLGVIPATALGLITGVLLGLLLDLGGPGLPRISAALLGVVVAFGLMLLVHFVGWVTTTDAALPTVTSEGVFGYLLFLGVPSVIYLITSGWMGWWLGRSTV